MAYAQWLRHADPGSVSLDLGIRRQHHRTIQSIPGETRAGVELPKSMVQFLQAGIGGPQPICRLERAGHAGHAAHAVLPGVVSTDLDGYYSGALSYLVSFDTSRMLAQLHELNFDLLAVVIGLHLAAIAWYGLRKRQNLVWPMVTGLASVLSDEASRLKHAPIIRAIVGLAVSGLLVAIIVFSSRF